MRFSSIIVILFASVLFGFSAVAADTTPVCVKNKTGAQALPNLSVLKKAKSSKRKSANAGPPPGSMTFPQYSPLKWTGKRDGGWYEVQTIDNITYWIRKRDLSFNMKCLIVLVGKTRMYKGPGPKFEKADLAEQGMVFMDMGGEDGWTQVQNAEGKRAWINLDHTWKPAARVRMSFSPER